MRASVCVCVSSKHRKCLVDYIGIFAKQGRASYANHTHTHTAIITTTTSINIALTANDNELMEYSIEIKKTVKCAGQYTHTRKVMNINNWLVMFWRASWSCFCYCCYCCVFIFFSFLFSSFNSFLCDSIWCCCFLRAPHYCCSSSLFWHFIYSMNVCICKLCNIANKYTVYTSTIISLWMRVATWTRKGVFIEDSQ